MDYIEQMQKLAEVGASLCSYPPGAGNPEAWANSRCDCKSLPLGARGKGVHMTGEMTGCCEVREAWYALKALDEETLGDPEPSERDALREGLALSGRAANTPLNYYIIEHPRRGTFREMDSEWRAGKHIEIPRFSRSGSRSDADKAQQFSWLAEAQAMLERTVAADGRVAQDCRIRRSSDFKALCPECGQWADEWHEHERTCPVYREEVARHGY